MKNFVELREQQSIKNEFISFYENTFFKLQYESILPENETEQLDKLILKAIQNIETAEKQFYKTLK